MNVYSYSRFYYGPRDTGQRAELVCQASRDWISTIRNDIGVGLLGFYFGILGDFAVILQCWAQHKFLLLSANFDFQQLFVSNAVLCGHHAELNIILSVVRKWVIF